MRNLLILIISFLSAVCMANKPEPPAPSEPDGIIGGYEYVDLGLPSGTLWATYNIGASSPYETGWYFAWGEVESREDFSWESYKFFKGYDYHPNVGYFVLLEDIGSNICGTEYDAARVQWGNGWRLPNVKERYELRMHCWQIYTTENGVPGTRIYGPNQHNIFLPGCGSGLWYGEKDRHDDYCSYYWVGEEDPVTGNGSEVKPNNWSMNFFVQSGGMQSGQTNKAYGICVRPVINPKESGIDNIVSDSSKISLAYSNGAIHILGNVQKGSLDLYDLSGRLIFSDNVVDNICRLTTLSSGIYIATFSCSGTPAVTKKITIK